MTLEEFDAALAYGAYAWPGGYPRYFFMADGEAVSFKAAEAEAQTIRNTITAGAARDDWFPIACEINWEDANLICAHTGERIESAYGEE